MGMVSRHTNITTVQFSSMKKEKVAVTSLEM